MNPVAITAILLLLAFSFSVSAQPATEQYTGTARDPDHQHLLYTETYTEQRDASGKLLSADVQYRDAKGQLAAEKSLRYTEHPNAPAFTFTNSRTGYRESVTWLSDGSLQLANADAASTLYKKTLQVPEPVVADAGFNEFIRANLDRLSRGDILSFNFLNPARLTWFRFVAEARPLDNGRIAVRIYPASTVLKWLVNPIDLVYRLTDGRLLQYQGLTNMRLEGNQNLNAQIIYEYTTTPDSALSSPVQPIEYRHDQHEG